MIYMKTQNDKVLLGSLIEKKMSEFEKRRRFMMTDEFYEMTIEEQNKLLNENRALRKEINFLKEKIDKLSLQNERLKEELVDVYHDGELWLGEVLEIEKPKFGANNLILSPVGSGKTFAITKHLVPQGRKNQLLLVSTTSLKDAVSKDLGANNALEDEGITAFTTQSKSNYDENEYNLWIMTYAEFGKRMRINDKFIVENEITEIYSDEIHSLIEYIKLEDSHDLYVTMRFLLQYTEGVRKFYFTATDENLRGLYQTDPNWFGEMSVYDYRNYEGIRKYTATNEGSFGHVNQLEGVLDNFTGDFITYGKKGIYFSRRISELEAFAEILEDKGFAPLVLWSKNNQNRQMTNEQLNAYDELLSTGQIPSGYDFLLINGALREGWNLNDKSVELVIINSTRETDVIQARGRVRKNVSTFLVRERGATLRSLEVPSVYLGVPLDSSQKRELTRSLNIVTDRGSLAGWGTVKKLLEKEGYTVKEKRQMIDGKRKRVSVIN